MSEGKKSKGKENYKKSSDYYKNGEILQTYLNGKYAKLIIALSFDNQESRSGTGKSIIKGHFNKMPEAEIARLLQLYEKMTPEERKNPGKRD